MSELDLRALLSVVDQHGVRFVAIGAIAVAAHGHVRATQGLDIVPDPDSENLKRLSEALVDLVATLPRAGGRPFSPERDEPPLHMGRSLTLETRCGGLDIVQRVPGVPPYDTLEREAAQSDLLGVPVRICSLAHLRQMKEHRATHQDMADLEGLPRA